MIVITTNEGTEIGGETALEVVADLNRRALIGEADAWRYMAAVSARMRRLHGVAIRTTSAALFLADLAATGLIRAADPTAPLAAREGGSPE